MLMPNLCLGKKVEHSLQLANYGLLEIVIDGRLIYGGMIQDTVMSLGQDQMTLSLKT
jgi:hypothetical protein